MTNIFISHSFQEYWPEYLISYRRSSIKSLTKSLARARATLGCRGTQVDNHPSRFLSQYANKLKSFVTCLSSTCEVIGD